MFLSIVARTRPNCRDPEQCQKKSLICLLAVRYCLIATSLLHNKYAELYSRIVSLIEIS